MTQIELPELALVCLIGASGSGKTTLAADAFGPWETLSSDHFRGLAMGDPQAGGDPTDAFETLYEVARRRLRRGLLTVLDATNVKKEDRQKVVALARECDVLPVAVVLDVPERVCLDRQLTRPEAERVPEHAVRRHVRDLRRSLKHLKKDGFREVHVLKPEQVADGVEVVRRRLHTDLRHEHGPFDIIGDVHGCYSELETLLHRLGWQVAPRELGDGQIAFDITPPEGRRRLVFVGDLVDRGPATPQVLKLVMQLVEDGHALCVPGNHDDKLKRWLRGNKVTVAHGLAESIEQLNAFETIEPGFRDQVRQFFFGLVSHLVLDDGQLVVAHGGLPERFQNRSSARVRDICLYGMTTGAVDENGLPERLDWAADYRGDAHVVYGHTPVSRPAWRNNTINIDTGCVFGGQLTALRWPERELVSVDAQAQYAQPLTPIADADQRRDTIEITDVLGARHIRTRLAGTVRVDTAQSHAALETMSRFAIDPRWLVYLPPTISPCETSNLPGTLEHPEQAFDYYQRAGVSRVVLEEKHMGSRMLAVVCRDESVGLRRFAIAGDGACFTRTGRPFFRDPAWERWALDTLRERIDTAGLWGELSTDWMLLDGELMPWSAKAEELIGRLYAPTATAGAAYLAAAQQAVAAAAARGQDVTDLARTLPARQQALAAYPKAFAPYVWPVAEPSQLRFAPFHLLASEGAAHFDRPHSWHLNMLDRLAEPDTFVQATERIWVDVADSGQRQDAVRRWEQLTTSGGEGMVVKPQEHVAVGKRGLIQPAVKVRGREYLRIIYGPEYDLDLHLSRLRQRGLGRKRSLAVREFSLGVQALELFCAGEPLHRVHECVYAILAMESTPVDPRL
jgi:protein phosphatase